MITRRQVIAAIAKRDELADQIRSYCRHLPFEACFKLSSPALREQYVAANRVACFMEQEIIAKGSAYRLKNGGLVWRSHHKWAARIVRT